MREQEGEDPRPVPSEIASRHLTLVSKPCLPDQTPREQHSSDETARNLQPISPCPPRDHNTHNTLQGWRSNAQAPVLFRFSYLILNKGDPSQKTFCSLCSAGSLCECESVLPRYKISNASAITERLRDPILPTVCRCRGDRTGRKEAVLWWISAIDEAERGRWRNRW